MAGQKNVLARMGDIFEGSADVTVLPCSGKGTISSATNRWIELFNLPSPKALQSSPTFGNLSELIPFSSSKSITKYVVFAASVLNDHSSQEIITSIGRKLGELTHRDPQIRVIETPLLGTGAGGLSTETAGKALFEGFRSTAHKDSKLYIFVFDRERQLALEKLFSMSSKPEAHLVSQGRPAEVGEPLSARQSVNIVGSNNVVVQGFEKQLDTNDKGINWTKWGTILTGIGIIVAILLAQPWTEPPKIIPATTTHSGVEIESTDDTVGRKLVFSAFDGNDFEVFVLDLDSNELSQITWNEHNDIEPSWSPSGDQIIFSSNALNNYDIHKMNSDGTNLVALTSHPANDTDPSWSRITGQIAFVSKRDGNRYSDIYVMNPDGTDQTNLTSNPNSDDTDPSWSPTNATLAFTSYRENINFGAEVYILNTNTTQSIPVAITNSPYNDRRPSWSADGMRLLFETDRNGHWDLYSISLQDSTITNLTPNSNADQQMGTWSADGQQIAYISVQPGSSETQIYIQNIDGSFPINKTNDILRPNFPDWWLGN